ncbi:Di-copper centre-containing protein [Ophiobolus disseminans]|uniref:Di-copper centre-containing protein n=1 Tax=Ophiobolus disseminans TaxID=1469910 RepID=A0A6A7AJP7_9PLEO|nr:Di-copper centre-containing protein [Ophiobolus disseminans]
MAKYFIILSLLLAFCTATSHRLRRHAWHTLTPAQNSSYISAELCLMHTPSKLSLPGTTSRYEELQAVHQLEMMQWFGGDGRPQDGCITNGPFVNFTNHLGPAYAYTSHCVTRRFNETCSAQTAQVFVDECVAKGDWLGAWTCIEGKPHTGGHGGVGGLMLDAVVSPRDPLFYLHHTWLDKIWADWQVRDLPKRLSEMGGDNVQDEGNLPLPFPPRPDSIPKSTGADGDPGNVTTLEHVLNMYGNGPNRTIGEVMDIWDGVLRYEYVEPETGGY